MLRGVWVVPVAGLSTWLRARDVTVPSDRLQALAARVVTDFPSTTTDPALLSAMAGAESTRRRGRRPRARKSDAAAPRAAMPRTRRGRRAVSVMGRLVLLCLGGGLAWAFLAHLPGLLEGLFEAPPGAAIPSAAPSLTRAPLAPPEVLPNKPAAPKPGAEPATTKRPVVAKPLGPPDCSDATAPEIASIIHRTVHPIVTNRGCAWGTRLDDRSTQLVSIVMTEDHNAFDAELNTSVKQKRVVYSGGLDTTYRPATSASVAAGQPITKGTKPVRARADTVVVVATTKLGVSDDKARAMAVAIAAAANY